MFRGKKLVAVVVLAVVIIAGSIGGVVFANTDNGSGVVPKPGVTMARVAEIYKEKTGTDLNVQALQDAMAQARNETMQQAMDARLKQMVESGKITQEQADQMKQWWESRPKDLPFNGGIMGPGKMGGGGFMRGFGGPCFQAPPAPSS